MKQNAILLASLIVLAVALTGAGVWVYVDQIAPKPAPVIQTAPSEQSEAEKQPQINDETADWEVYRNEEWGFEFKYQKNNYEGIWVDEESKNKINFGNHWVGVENLGSDAFLDYVGNKYPERCAMCDMESAQNNECAKFCFEEKNILVGEFIEAKEIQYRVINSGRLGVAAYFAKGDKVYSIGYEASSPYFWPQLYDEMIKTFKFSEFKIANDGNNFTGKYSFRNPENEYGGTLLVEQLSEKEINFAISVNMGAPGYNSGSIYKTKLFLNDNVAIYENNEYGDCKFKIIFNDEKAIIEYISELPNSGFNCGFGHGVYVNGSYPKTDSNTPDFEKIGPRIN